MLRAFDSVLASSDMSLDRVLNAGLPAALIFYNRELPADLRQRLDDLARQHAGKLLIVTLARNDAPQALSRFGVRQLPSLVLTRENKAIANLDNVRATDIQPHIAYLLGEGPRPSAPTSDRARQASKTSTKGPVSVNEAEFEREVLQSDRPVLVDFWAPWCAPCRMVAPALDAIARDQGSAMKVVKVNVDDNPGLARRYNAMSIPTMIVVKGGREVDRWVGALPEPAIRSRVARWI